MIKADRLVYTLFLSELIILTFYDLPSHVSEASTDCSHWVFIPDKDHISTHSCDIITSYKERDNIRLPAFSENTINRSWSDSTAE